MVSRMDEFREFVSKHPGIKEEVKQNNTTWQRVYEDWVILGENDSIWTKYKIVETTQNNSSNTIEEMLSTTSLKNAFNYIKKIDPDQISKTLNTVQKVLQITQSFGGKPTGIYNNNYNSWWD